MEKNLELGEVIGGTLSVVSDNREAALIFIAVLTALGVAFEWGVAQMGSGFLDQFENAEWLLSLFGIGAGLGGIVFLIVAVVAQYLLWETMIRRYHQLAPGYDRRILGFVGLAIMTSLGVSVGYLLLIIPGLIFSARWSMAPAMLIAEHKGVFDAMGASWEEVRGNTTPVVLAIVIVGVAVIGVNVVIGAGATFSGTASGLSLVATVVGQLTSQAVSVLAAAMGVFLFGRLRGSPEILSEVFE